MEKGNHILSSIMNNMTVTQIKSRSSKKLQHGAKTKEDYTFALLLDLLNRKIAEKNSISSTSLSTEPKLTRGAKDAIATNEVQANQDLYDLTSAASHGCETWKDLKLSLLRTPSTNYTKQKTYKMLHSVIKNMTVKQMKNRTSKRCHYKAKLKDDFAYSLLLTMFKCNNIESALRKVTVDVRNYIDDDVTENDFNKMKEMAKCCNTWMDLKNIMIRGLSDLDNINMVETDNNNSQILSTNIFENERKSSADCAAALERAAPERAAPERAAKDADSRVYLLKKAALNYHFKMKQREQILKRQHQQTQNKIAFKLAQETQRAEKLSCELIQLNLIKEEEKNAKRYQELLNKKMSLNSTNETEELGTSSTTSTIITSPSNFNQNSTPPTLRHSKKRERAATSASTIKIVSKDSKKLAYDEEVHPGKECMDSFSSSAAFFATLIFLLWIVYTLINAGSPSALQLGEKVVEKMLPNSPIDMLEKGLVI